MNRLPLFTIVLLAGVLSGQESSGNAPASNSLNHARLAAHASLSQHNPPGISLRTQLAEARAQASSRGITAWNGLDIVVTGHESVSPVPMATLLVQHYAAISRTADAIVIGRQRSFRYHLSAWETAIYGDHLFSIETVLKDNAVHSIQQGAEIVITRPGGSLTLSEGPVSMQFSMYPALRQNTTYLLFLRYIRPSSGYTTVDHFSTLLLDAEDTWTITHGGYSSLRLPELSRGTFEAKIVDWRKEFRHDTDR